MNRVEGINRGVAGAQVLETLDIPSLEGRVSDQEWAIRVDLAAAYRMVAHYGWDDLIFTHLSARIPGPEHHFLLNPYNLMFEEVTASSLIKVDTDGNPVEPTPFITNPAGFTAVQYFSVYQNPLLTDVDLGVLVCFDEQTGEFLWQHSSEKLITGRVHDWPLQGICDGPYVEGKEVVAGYFTVEAPDYDGAVAIDAEEALGGRVEHDRRVLTGEVHRLTRDSPARRIAPTITSSSSSLRRQSTASGVLAAIGMSPRGKPSSTVSGALQRWKRWSKTMTPCSDAANTKRRSAAIRAARTIRC